MRYFLPPLFAVLALAACTAPISASAQNDVSPARTIVISGTGEASAEPDMATIIIGVETQSPTAGEAIEKNNAQISETIKTLKSLGVADRDMQTASLSVAAQYDYNSNRSTPRITGYTASNSLYVKLRDLDKAGQILDKTISAGANRLNNMSLGFADPQPLMDKARVDAVADAQRKAKLYAGAAGVALGPLLQINDGATPISPRPAPMMRMEAAQDSSVPIERGESTLQATVTLVYTIK